MALTIRNRQLDRLARQLAELTGEPVAEAVRKAVAERYDRLVRERDGRSLADELYEIGLRCSALPVVSPLSEDEILGYDEWGAPTR